MFIGACHRVLLLVYICNIVVSSNNKWHWYYQALATKFIGAELQWWLVLYTYDFYCFVVQEHVLHLPSYSNISQLKFKPELTRSFVLRELEGERLTYMQPYPYFVKKLFSRLESVTFRSQSNNLSITQKVSYFKILNKRRPSCTWNACHGHCIPD